MKIKVSSNIIDCEVIKENPKTVWVKLGSGKIIKRHKVKHAPSTESQS